MLDVNTLRWLIGNLRIVEFVASDEILRIGVVCDSGAGCGLGPFLWS